MSSFALCHFPKKVLYLVLLYSMSKYMYVRSRTSGNLILCIILLDAAPCCWTSKYFAGKYQQTSALGGL